MTNLPMLAIPNPKQKLQLETDVSGYAERGKRDIYCDKKVEEVVTIFNCILKGLWKERGSRDIRKKLKYKAQLICNVKIDKMMVGSI